MLNKFLSLSALALCPSLALTQSYVVYDFTHNKVLESHLPNHIQPIASVTKLMTANVFLEHNKNPNCTASITSQDADHIKGTGTRLPRNTPISCHELLKAMLIHSDNYAAHALSRAAGMSRAKFIEQMNKTAKKIGMKSTRFSDSSGLSASNVSNAMDLVKLAKYSMQKPKIQALSNTKSTYIRAGNKIILMENTNRLVREELFEAAVNKTGYIRESGYNLVFVNKYKCNKAIIGVISLNNRGPNARANFTRSKLQQYGCPTLTTNYVAQRAS
ncbi:D-alanyl-D-alanine endopeptidase [Pasteurellaceae bacterium RH1A]|nr:D-alanyl-D-alanine endopeptidase [Pasteurellaceae bacterium RH1A]